MNHPASVPRWLVAFAAGLFVTAGLAVGAWAVELPYIAWSPGPTLEATDAIVPAEGVETHSPDGDLLVLTISSQPLNVYELLVAIFDPTVDVYDRIAVRRQDETDEEYRNRVLGDMDEAVQTAMVVAFERLGMDLTNLRYRIVTVFGEYPAASVLEPGDLVLEVEGQPMDSIDVIREQLAGRAAGDTVDLTIEREGAVRTVEVELGETTDEDTGETRTIVGIEIGPYVHPDLDPPADIDTNNVGGPSAGMMYTLALIELLDADDLTRGHIVAGTGTIALDGSVGGIGGIRQKVVAAEAAGAAYMLVPDSNYEDALTADREDMELVRVATIDDALAFLESLEPA